MGIMNYLPFVSMILIYLILFGGILYLIYKWVTKFIALKQEQNDLLREIIKKMDNR